MYTADWFKGKRVTVMGLGTLGGGIGVSKWLLRHGAALTVTDLRSRKELAKSLKELDGEYRSARAAKLNACRPRFVLGRHDRADFSGADLVIRNPAVRRTSEFLEVASRSGVPVETDISLFLQLCPFPVTAITGTKGKSTVTALIGEIASRHDRRAVVGGNIRISPFEHLDRLLGAAANGEPPVPVVLELSSWQLEGVERSHISPHVGVVTNVMRDHLNTYRGMADYARAKSLIIAYQSAGDFAVLNRDDARVWGMGRGRRISGAKFAGRRFAFSARPLREDGCFVRNGWVVLRERGTEKRLLPLSSVRLLGRYNFSNVLAACAAAHLMGIPARTIATAVRNFRGIAGRLEELTVKRGITYYNDTTATMPDASLAAVRALAERFGRGRVVLLAGGADKNLRFGEWGRGVAGLVRGIVLFEGTATPKLEWALKRARYDGPLFKVSDMGSAVRIATRLAMKGDAVVLSPACASFGLFKNEFDRGERYEKEVNER